MNIGVHVSLSDLFSLVCMPRSGIAGPLTSLESPYLWSLTSVLASTVLIKAPTWSLVTSTHGLYHPSSDKSSHQIHSPSFKKKIYIYIYIYMYVYIFSTFCFKETGAAEDEMVREHHWLNGCESEQTPGDSEGLGKLACCSPWGHKELGKTQWLNNNNIFFRHNFFLF